MSRANNENQSPRDWEKILTGDSVKNRIVHMREIVRKLLAGPGHRESCLPTIEFRAQPKTQLISKERARTNREGYRWSRNSRYRGCVDSRGGR